MVVNQMAGLSILMLGISVVIKVVELSVVNQVVVSGGINHMIWLGL